MSEAALEKLPEQKTTEPKDHRRIIDFDTETTGLQPWSGKQRGFLYQFFDGEKLDVLRPETDREKIQAWFDSVKDDPNAFLRAWNAKFDKSFAYKDGFDIPGDGKWLDGMLSAHALDENRSVALKSVADSVLGPQASDLQKEVKAWLTEERRRRKTEAQKNGTELIEPTYADVPDELMEKYGAEDVLLTRKVCAVQDPIIEKTPTLKGVVDFEHEVMDALWHVERRGFPVSELGYRRLEAEVADNLEVLEERVLALAQEADAGVFHEAIEGRVDLEDFNMKSTPHIIAALKARGADMSHMSKKNGKYSADVENLKAVDDELAVAILEFRSEFKALSTYISPYIGRSYVPAMRVWKEPFISADGRIHANFRQVGTKTGRMSCIAEGSYVDAPRDLVQSPLGIKIEDVQPGMHVYSFDKYGDPRPKKVLRVLKQGRKPVLKLVWRASGNKSYLGELKATPDHLVRLIDGSYRRMDALQPGDKLAYLSRQVTQDGYARLGWKLGSGNGVRASVDEHRWLVNDGEVTHHRNERKLDNRIENLEAMSVGDHMALHNPKGIKRPERNKPCPYSRNELDAMLIDGIKSCIARYGHDHRTYKRWAAEYSLSIPDRRKAAMPVNHVVVAVIDEAEEVETYDLTIEDTPNFVVNEVGVHNCSDPNLQNQPRDDLRLRYNFVAEPGMKLVTCDLSNIEMRVFAAYAGEGALLNALREGKDIHVLTAEMIGIRDRERAGGVYESARQRGKTFNFAMVYGGGTATIRKQQRCTQDEARLMLQRYKDAYPEVVRLQNRIAFKLQDRGFIQSAWGRRFHVDPRDAYKAVNYLVQGTSADLLKAALVRLHKQGVPIIAAVHDELIAMVPEAEAEETKRLIIEALVDHPRITDKVPLEAEGVIIDRWSDAKPLEEKDDDGNKTGRLYYFDPKWANVPRRYVES